MLSKNETSSARGARIPRLRRGTKGLLNVWAGKGDRRRKRLQNTKTGKTVLEKLQKNLDPKGNGGEDKECSSRTPHSTRKKSSYLVANGRKEKGRKKTQDRLWERAWGAKPKVNFRGVGKNQRHIGAGHEQGVLKAEEKEKKNGLEWGFSVKGLAAKMAGI